MAKLRNVAAVLLQLVNPGETLRILELFEPLPSDGVEVRTALSVIDGPAAPRCALDVFRCHRKLPLVQERVLVPVRVAHFREGELAQSRNLPAGGFRVHALVEKTLDNCKWEYDGR